MKSLKSEGFVDQFSNAKLKKLKDGYEKNRCENDKKSKWLRIAQWCLVWALPTAIAVWLLASFFVH